MTSKKYIFIVAIILVIAAGGGWYYATHNKTTQPGTTEKPIEQKVGGEIEAPKFVDNKVVGEKPEFKELTPSTTAEIKKEEYTKPEATITSPDKKITINRYTITADKGQFTPAKIIVEKGKQIEIHFKAVDRDYDFAIAKPIMIFGFAPKGQSTTIAFPAQQPGIYEFTCQRACPENKTIKGEIIIK